MLRIWHFETSAIQFYNEGASALNERPPIKLLQCNLQAGAASTLHESQKLVGQLNFSDSIIGEKQPARQAFLELQEAVPAGCQAIARNDLQTFGLAAALSRYVFGPRQRRRRTRAGS